jgi:hypothetical protein
MSSLRTRLQSSARQLGMELPTMREPTTTLYMDHIGHDVEAWLKGLTALPRSTDSPRDIPGPSVGDDEDEI